MVFLFPRAGPGASIPDGWPFAKFQSGDAETNISGLFLCLITPLTNLFPSCMNSSKLR